MRKALALILAVLAATLGREIAPAEGPKKTKVVVDGKSYNYWLVDADVPAKFEVSGLGTVKIFVRTEAGTERVVTVLLDSVRVAVDTVAKKASRKAKSRAFKRISKAHTILLRVPRGKHTLDVVVDGPAAVRAVSKKKTRTVSMVPQEHAGGLVLVANEEEYGYYIATKKKPVVFSILGKGKVTLYTRLIYTPGMMGTQHYHLVVQLDDEKPVVYEFETEPSGVSYFRNDKSSVPGKAKKIKVDIPKGTHTLRVYPKGKKRVAIRLAMPLGMVKKR